METSSKQHAAAPISEERADAIDVGSMNSPQDAVELPVPRVDDDDFAPTIVRGRE